MPLHSCQLLVGKGSYVLMAAMAATSTITHNSLSVFTQHCLAAVPSDRLLPECPSAWIAHPKATQVGHV